MGITKVKPNVWKLDVRVKRLGKEYRKRETFFGTKTEAEDRLSEIRKDLKGKAKIVDSSEIKTFGDLINTYERNRETIPEKEKSRFDRLKNEFQDCPIEELPDRLEWYLDYLRTSTDNKLNRPLSTPTINRIRSLAKAIVNSGVKSQKLKFSPLNPERFKNRKEIPRDIELSQEEIQKLRTVMKVHAPYLIPIFEYAIRVPSRKSELINMKRVDCNLKLSVVRIRNGTTKNNKGFYKPIPKAMTDYFKKIPKESEYVFYRIIDGKFIPLGDFKNSWKTCLKKAGIKNFRFHDSRHISATNMILNGSSERSVMSIAGWQTNMLRTYYNRSNIIEAKESKLYC